MISNPERNEEKSGIKSFLEKKQEIVTEDIWTSFIKHCIVVQRLHPRSTVPHRIKKLKYLERNGINLINLDQDHIHTFFYSKIQSGSANAGLNNYAKALNSWLKFRGIEKKIENFKEHISPIKVPSIDDIQAMLDVVSERNQTDRRDRMLIVFFCKTGLRCAELCNLKLDDIDWKNAEIIVKKGKGGKDRIIPVEIKVLKGINYPSLKNYIKLWRFPVGDTVFTTENSAIKTVYIRKRIKDIAKKAGVPWIHPHSFRHFYATNLLKSGARLTIVQQLLGHAKLSSTERYLHTSATDIRETIHNMPIYDIIRNRKKHSKTKFRRLYAKSTGRF